jgi:hypothetical protein
LGQESQSCTPDLLFTSDGRGGAVVEVGGEGRIQNESGPGTSDVEGTEDRGGRKS